MNYSICSTTSIDFYHTLQLTSTYQIPYSKVSSIYQIPVSKILFLADLLPNNSFHPLPLTFQHRDRPINIEKFASMLRKQKSPNPIECSALIQIFKIMSTENNQIIKNGLYKKEDSDTRFFHTKDWTDWTDWAGWLEWIEYRTYLGRVVSLFKDYLCHNTPSVKKRFNN